MDGHICLVQLVFLLNVLYAQSPANGGGKLYLGHVDNEDFISDLQLSKSCCILSAYFLCGRSAAVSFLHRQSAAYGAVPFHEGHLKHWMARPSGRYPGYGAIFLQFRSSGVHRRKALRSSAPYRYHIHLARYGLIPQFRPVWQHL